MKQLSGTAWLSGGVALLSVGVLVTTALVHDDDERPAVPTSPRESAHSEAHPPNVSRDGGSGGGRHNVASDDGLDLESADGMSSETTRAPLDATKEVLAVFAMDAVHGVIQVNAVLEHALSILSLPIDQRPDFEYEDDDAIAYAIRGLPEGMTGHILVGLQPYSENGHTYRYLQMDVDIPTETPEYLEGAFRDGPNMNFSVSYDVEDPTKPVRFALMLQRSVDLYTSRQNGVNAYTGSYTQGGYFSQDLLDLEKVSATTFGLVDAKLANAKDFPLARPLVGDLRLDPELLNEVLGQLQVKLSYVKGK